MAVPVVGSQARGKAGVFGSSINPLQVLLQNQARLQKRQDELLKEERERRENLLDDYEKWAPNKVRDPFYGEINNIAQSEVRDYFHLAYNEGVPVEIIRKNLQQKYGMVNTKVSEINYKMDEYDAAMKMLEGDEGKYYKVKQTKAAIRDLYFNGVEAKPSSDIDPTKIQNVYDDVDNFDIDAIVVDFMNTVPLEINQRWTEAMGQLGKEYNIQETETKLGWQYDERGNIVIDPRTGKPKISLTDDVFISAMRNPYLQRIVDKYVPDQNVAKQKQFLQGLLEGYDPATIKNRPQLGFKLDDRERWARAGYTVDPVKLESRFDLLNTVTGRYAPDQLAAFASILGEVDANYTGFKTEGKLKIPTEITITFPSNIAEKLAEEAQQPVKEGQEDPYSLIREFMSANKKTLKPLKLKVGTEEDRFNTMIKLSNLLDRTDERLGPVQFTKFLREMQNKGRFSGIKMTKGESWLKQ